MEIGEIIRRCRKQKNLTQEEMANRLGVTAPAVNKWENGGSLPDITMLAPIARLLDITVDTLLSFRDNLTPEEINGIVRELDVMFEQKPYREVFAWAKKKLEEYPSCEQLIWQVALILDARRMCGNTLSDEAQEAKAPEECEALPFTLSPDTPARALPEDTDQYDDAICALYERVLESVDESLRNRGADSLYQFYMHRKQYDRAEEYLQYFSLQNPERKRKQAEIYAATGRTQEAFRTWEELLFAEYGILSATLHGMFLSALKENDMEKARLLMEKDAEMARCFEMGKYHEAAIRLELAVTEKDAETTVSVMTDMLSGAEQINGFCRSRLYEHMHFKELSPEFCAKVKTNLLTCFKDEAAYGFLKDNKRWQELTGSQK